jgi:hypothetical protein
MELDLNDARLGTGRICFEGVACLWRYGDGLGIIWCNGDLFAFERENETARMKSWSAQQEPHEERAERST